MPFLAVRSDSDRIIREAKETAAAQLKQSENQAKNAALEISKKVLTKIIDELFTKQEKEKIIARDIQKLTKYE